MSTWRDGMDRTLMSAFVVDPMDAQRPRQMFVGPLLGLWALAQRIGASQGKKLEKALTKARTKENEHMARGYGPNLDVSLCCGPNGRPKAAPNVCRAMALPLGAGTAYWRLTRPKAIEKPLQQKPERRKGAHGARVWTEP